jgi:hypothetical protein
MEYLYEACDQISGCLDLFYNHHQGDFSVLGGQKLKKKVRSVGKGVLIIGIILDPVFECH